jgi:hypothetical protein
LYGPSFFSAAWRKRIVNQAVDFGSLDDAGRLVVIQDRANVFQIDHAIRIDVRHAHAVVERRSFTDVFLIRISMTSFFPSPVAMAFA